MAKIPIILEPGRADGKLIKTNSVYDDDQEKFLSDKIKDIDDNHNTLKDNVNELTNIVNNNESDIENKLETEKTRATNAENNLRETINNITEISGSSTTANIVTINTIPNTSSSNVQQALNELFENTNNETQARSQNDQLLSQAIAAEQERAETEEQANATAIDAAVTKNEEQDQKLSELYPLKPLVAPIANLSNISNENLGALQRLTYTSSSGTSTAQLTIFSKTSFSYQIIDASARNILYTSFKLIGLEQGKKYKISFDVIGDKNTLSIRLNDNPYTNKYSISIDNAHGELIIEKDDNLDWCLYTESRYDAPTGYTFTLTNLAIIDVEDKGGISIEPKYIPSLGDISKLETESKNVTDAINEVKDSIPQEDIAQTKEKVNEIYPLKALVNLENLADISSENRGGLQRLTSASSAGTSTAEVIILDKTSFTFETTDNSGRQMLYTSFVLKGLKQGKTYKLSFNYSGSETLGRIILNNDPYTTIRQLDFTDGICTVVFEKTDDEVWAIYFQNNYSVPTGYKFELSNLVIQKIHPDINIDTKYIPNIGDINALDTKSKEVVGAINEVRDTSVNKDKLFDTTEPHDYIDFTDATPFKTDGTIGSYETSKDSIKIVNAGRDNGVLFFEVVGLERGKTYTFSGKNLKCSYIRLYTFTSLYYDGNNLDIASIDTQDFSADFTNTHGRVLLMVSILYSTPSCEVTQLKAIETGVEPKTLIKPELIDNTPIIGNIEELEVPDATSIVDAINKAYHNTGECLRKEDVFETIEPHDYVNMEEDDIVQKYQIDKYTLTANSIELTNTSHQNKALGVKLKGLIHGESYTIKGNATAVDTLRIYRYNYSTSDGDFINIPINTDGTFSIDFELTTYNAYIYVWMLYNVSNCKVDNISIIKVGDEPYETFRLDSINNVSYKNLDESLVSAFPMYGKELFTIGDSECAGGFWQKRVSEITGCIFDQEKNSKSGSPLSLGGTSMYGSSLEMGLIRVTNLVKEEYHPDYIILENVNDQSAWSFPDARLGAITDNAHFITNLLDGGLKSDWDSDAVTLLASIPSENRQFGTSIQLTANVAGKNVKITSMPTKNGNVKLRLHEDDYNQKDYVISVSSTDTLLQILDKILEYDYEWFVDTLDSEGTGVDFSYHGPKGQSNVNVTLIDVDNTGMQISVSDTDQAKSVTLKHYYGKTLNDNDWTDINNWRDTVKFYEAWKGVIEYCLKNFPTAQLYILVFPHLGNVYPANYLNADGSYNMEAYRSAFSNVKSLYSAQRALAEYYNLPCIDLVANMGISPANMAAWFPNGNVHPTPEGFRYLGEKIAKIILNK